MISFVFICSEFLVCELYSCLFESTECEKRESFEEICIGIFLSFSKSFLIKSYMYLWTVECSNSFAFFLTFISVSESNVSIILFTAMLSLCFCMLWLHMKSFDIIIKYFVKYLMLFFLNI